MAYGDFKDLPRGTAADKVLRDKAFNIAKNLGFQRGLLHWFIRFLIKRLLTQRKEQELNLKTKN